MENTEFVKRVLEIAETNPTYRTGGDGSDGTCDCIGLIMGALGKDFPMHSTNYFARFEMAELSPIRKGTVPEIGNLVYKARDEGSPGYDLHERYRQGGRYFASTMLDYYHVGVVTGAEPLVITHCTQTDGVDGIDYDTSLTGWSYIGEAADVGYDELPDDAPLPDLAVVYSDNHDPVRLRSSPSTGNGYNTIAKVPFGAEVLVLESSPDWATITWNGKRGYMQKQYLRVIGMAPAESDSEVVIPPVDTVVPISFEAKVLAKLDEILTLLKGGAS